MATGALNKTPPSFTIPRYNGLKEQKCEAIRMNPKPDGVMAGSIVGRESNAFWQKANTQKGAELRGGGGEQTEDSSYYASYFSCFGQG